MTTIAFFGGTGFVGTAFARYLAKNKSQHQLLRISRHAAALNLPQCISCNVLDRSTFSSIGNSEIVIHGVSDSTNGPATSDFVKIEKSIISTINILNYSKNIGAKHFIFLSSGAVYGDIEQPKETDCYINLDLSKKSSSYALGKLSSENYIRSFCEQNNIAYTILRAFTFGGIDLPCKTHYALGNFIMNVINDEDIIIKGDGKVTRSYMHQDDLSRVLLELCTEEGEGQIFNIGSDHPYTMQELAKRIIDISGAKVDFKILGQGKTHNKYYVPDITKITERLGGILYHNLDDIIRDMLDSKKE